MAVTRRRQAVRQMLITLWPVWLVVAVVFCFQIWLLPGAIVEHLIGSAAFFALAVWARVEWQDGS